MMIFSCLYHVLLLLFWFRFWLTWIYASCAVYVDYLSIWGKLFIFRIKDKLRTQEIIKHIGFNNRISCQNISRSVIVRLVSYVRSDNFVVFITCTHLIYVLFVSFPFCIPIFISPIFRVTKLYSFVMYPDLWINVSWDSLTLLMRTWT